MIKSEIQTSTYALNFGTLIGIVTVVFNLMLFFLDAHYQGEPLSWIVPVLISVGLINYGIFQYRKDNNGYVSISESLKVGVGAALMAGIIGTLYGLLLTEFLDPQFMDKTLEIAKQKMLEGNKELSIEDANNAIEVSKNFTTIPIRIAGGLLSSIFSGFFISLIGGLILKKSKPE
jgi:hypothetical protein|tara:strand:- start:6630 stop:7154 length:525 start_codon:yes stop_codon:yes gene_type:complete